jgi:hypothetical protein
MQTWEYLKRTDITVDQLNELGLEGWNLVNFTQGHNINERNVLYYVFKRALESTALINESKLCTCFENGISPEFCRCNS